MKQKTAVEWFEENIPNINMYIPIGMGLEFKTKLQHAKQMYEAQIKDAWDRGQYVGMIFPQGKIEDTFEQDSDQYFNEMYKK